MNEQYQKIFSLLVFITFIFVYNFSSGPFILALIALGLIWFGDDIHMGNKVVVGNPVLSNPRYRESPGILFKILGWTFLLVGSIGKLVWPIIATSLTV